MGVTSSRRTWTLLGVFVGSAAGCGAGSVEYGDHGAPPEIQSEVAPTEKEKPRHSAADNRARSAVRCSECHADTTEQWTQSTHAKSNGPLYQAMLAEQEGHEAIAACDSCHRPLAAIVDPDLPVVAEGVTCDVCHSVSNVEIGETNAKQTFDLDSTIKYGPLCDAKDHYFHRMGCSQQHQVSDICAGCHHLIDHSLTPALPIYSEYSDWKSGDYAGSMVCQSCHMEMGPGEVAVGWDQPREGVHSHTMMGDNGALRKTSATLSATARVRGQSLRVEAVVKNSAAGHSIPTGLPGRRLVVRAEVQSREGAVVSETEVELGRVLVDREGRPAPFYRASRLASNTSIPPDESATLTLDVDRHPTGTLVVTLGWRPISKVLAQQLGVPSRPDVEIARGQFNLSRNVLKFEDSSKTK